MVKKVWSRITNNFGLKLLAFVFACALWLVVVNVDDPVTTRSFTTTVSIENENYLKEIGKYYGVENNTSTVSFKVSGKRSFLERMSGSDFKAVADLETIEDFKRVPIEITPQRYANSVSIVNKTYYLEVEVEELKSQSFVINVETKGELSSMYALGKMSTSPNILRVSGPESVVNTIASVVAVVDVEGMTDDIIDSVIPEMRTEQGTVVDPSELTFNMQSITVSVQIWDQKEVSMNFQTKGVLPEGYSFGGIHYTPKTVKIKGESSILNTINSITIPPAVIDLTGAKEDVEKVVDIAAYLPEGVYLADDCDGKIHVGISIDKHETRKYHILTKNITTSNLTEGYKVVFASDKVEVEISGNSSDLDELKAEELTGNIDASGMEPGDHSLNLELNLDDKYESEKIVSVNVDIVEQSE